MNLSIAMLATIVAAYAVLVTAVAATAQNRVRRHARILSAPRLYGRRFTPRHAETEPAAREHADSAEMELAA
jgi:hypothetical protein